MIDCILHALYKETELIQKFLSTWCAKRSGTVMKSPELTGTDCFQRGTKLDCSRSPFAPFLITIEQSLRSNTPRRGWDKDTVSSFCVLSNRSERRECTRNEETKSTRCREGTSDSRGLLSGDKERQKAKQTIRIPR